MSQRQNSTAQTSKEQQVVPDPQQILLNCIFSLVSSFISSKAIETSEVCVYDWLSQELKVISTQKRKETRQNQNSVFNQSQTKITDFIDVQTIKSQGQQCQESYLMLNELEQSSQSSYNRNELDISDYREPTLQDLIQTEGDLNNNDQKVSQESSKKVSFHPSVQVNEEQKSSIQQFMKDKQYRQTRAAPIISQEDECQNKLISSQISQIDEESQESDQEDHPMPEMQNSIESSQEAPLANPKSESHSKQTYDYNYPWTSQEYDLLHQALKHTQSTNSKILTEFINNNRTESAQKTRQPSAVAARIKLICKRVKDGTNTHEIWALIHYELAKIQKGAAKATVKQVKKKK